MAYVPPHRRRRPKPVINRQKEQTQQSRNTSNQPWNHKNSNDLSLHFCNAFSRICCINLKSRQDKWQRFQRQADRIGIEFHQKLERFDAINGKEVLVLDNDNVHDGDDKSENKSCLNKQKQHAQLLADCVQLEWDTTQNAKWDRHVEPGITRIMTTGEVGCALSHVALWKQLVSAVDADQDSMLIFEDDATFLTQQAKNQQQSRFQKINRSNSRESSSRFLEAFSQAWSLLPDDWDIFYLGLSDRGDRLPVEIAFHQTSNAQDQNVHARSSAQLLQVMLFRPTYGFHTHAYAIRKEAATRLLTNLPVSGPLDVWLADNNWFDLNVYIPIVLNEGWRGTGAPLVFQSKEAGSDVGMSSRSRLKTTNKDK